MKSSNFEIHELVSKAVYNKYGEKSWLFFDPRLIITMDWIRDTIDRPIIINTWFWGGNLSQRGLRENLSPIVKEKTRKNILYLSPHPLGMAVDFDVEGMTSNEFIYWLEDNKKDLPFNIRIERGVKWNHLDVFDMGERIYYFNP